MAVHGHNHNALATDSGHDSQRPHDVGFVARTLLEEHKTAVGVSSPSPNPQVGNQEWFAGPQIHGPMRKFIAMVFGSMVVDLKLSLGVRDSACECRSITRLLAQI